MVATFRMMTSVRLSATSGLSLRTRAASTSRFFSASALALRLSVRMNFTFTRGYSSANSR